MGRSRKLVMLCGMREIGKTTKVKKLLTVRDERKIILDNSRQPGWKHLPEIPLEWMKSQTKGTYVTYATDRYREWFQILRDHWGSDEGVKIGGTAVVEDASAVLKEKKEEDIYNICVGLRHVNVDLILVTHAIRDTPRYIIPQLNEFIFLKGTDSWDEIADRFPEHVRDAAREKFDKVYASKNMYACEALTIVRTGTKVW